MILASQVPERFTELGKEWIQAFQREKKQQSDLIEPAKPEPVKIQLTPQVNPVVVKIRIKEPVEQEVLTPPSALPPIETSANHDVRELARGLELKTGIEYQKGGLASKERRILSNYQAEYKLKVTIPEPSKKIDDLIQVNRRLPELLPELREMMQQAKVSSFYYELYRNKQKRLRQELTQLGRLTTRHNFYDCETMLEMTHPKTLRKVLLIQSEMDVVSDGSDGDRLPEMPEEIINSTYYQPFTSYAWPKMTKQVNPMQVAWEKRLKAAETELAAPQTTVERKRWLRERIKNLLTPGIEDMKRRSFLIAEYDPFIVIPLHMMNRRDAVFSPKAGDYAVVMHDNQLYPAIVGDAGPNFKVGEASLRLARQISPNSSPYTRPVSDLKVTYLVFPGTADAVKSAPDYEKWKSTCEKLMEDIGGYGSDVKMHQWEDILKPKPVEANPTNPSNNQTIAPNTQSSPEKRVEENQP